MLLKNTNRHNYQLNRVLLVLSTRENICIDKEGVEGNHVDFTREGSWRLATDDEIRRAFR